MDVLSLSAAALAVACEVEYGDADPAVLRAIRESCDADDDAFANLVHTFLAEARKLGQPSLQRTALRLRLGELVDP